MPLYIKYEGVRMKEQTFRKEVKDRVTEAFMNRFGDLLGDSEVDWGEVLHRDRPLEVEGIYVDPRVVYYGLALSSTLRRLSVTRSLVHSITMPNAVTQDVLFLSERVGRGDSVFRRLQSFMRFIESENAPPSESDERVQEAGKPLLEWLQRLRNRLEVGQPLEGLCLDCPFTWVQREI